MPGEVIAVHISQVNAPHIVTCLKAAQDVTTQRFERTSQLTHLMLDYALSCFLLEQSSWPFHLHLLTSQC